MSSGHNYFIEDCHSLRKAIHEFRNFGPIREEERSTRDPASIFFVTTRADGRANVLLDLASVFNENLNDQS